MHVGDWKCQFKDGIFHASLMFMLAEGMGPGVLSCCSALVVPLACFKLAILRGMDPLVLSFCSAMVVPARRHNWFQF